MVRARLAGGVLSPAQWLAFDHIARTWANNTLRITTRQTFQLHGVLKRDLKRSIAQMNKALATLARLNNCTVLLINQPRAAVGSMMSGDVSAGPKHMQHATTAKIDMYGLGGDDKVRKLKLPGETEPLVVSAKTRIRVPRMKNGLPGRVVESYVNRITTAEYGPAGIDIADEYITLAVRANLVKQGGAWYTMPDGHRVNGRIAFARYIREHPDARKVLREALTFDAPIDPLEDD